MKLIRFLLISMAITVSALSSGLVFADNYAKTIEVFKNSPAVEFFFENAYSFTSKPEQCMKQLLGVKSSALNPISNLRVYS